MNYAHRRGVAGAPRLLLILVAIPMLALLAGRDADAQERPRYGGELVYVVPTEPASYDGHRERTFALIHPLAPVYSTLLRFDPTDRTGTKVIGDLAESWTIAKDGRTYTFELRRGVKFHDGSDVRDFERRLLDEEAHYFYTLQWHRIIPHSAKIHSWTVTPSHFVNNQLDGVWLSE
jgi:ABC-type transport system substrate-binding protein